MMEKAGSSSVSTSSSTSSVARQDAGDAKAKSALRASLDIQAAPDDNDFDDSDDRDRDNDNEKGKQPAGTLARVLSRVSTRSRIASDPGPPPNGGTAAWIAVGCTHLVIMNTWGVVSSFGTFQTYYTTLLDMTPSTIAWIGSVQIFLLFFIGTLTGRLTDAGYFRQLLALGSVLQIVGIFCTAQATQYWQILLAQGVCIGLGNGCLFCPALATLGTYWSSRRSMAIGIAAVGSATGGLVYPSIVRQLLPQVGFAWTMRALGFVQAATLLVANAGMRTRLPPRRTGSLVEWSAFREPPYAFYAAGSFFCFWSVYIVFFYLASFSRDIIGLSYTPSLNLLLLINGVGAVGRLVPNIIADRVGVVNMFILFAFAGGLCAVAWTGVHSTTGLYVWTVFYGIAAGGIQSLFPAGLSALNAKDLSKAGVRIGMVFTLNSIATLTGPPIAGALVSAQDGSYLGAQLFTGLSLLVGACFLVCAKIASGRETGLGWRSRV